MNILYRILYCNIDKKIKHLALASFITEALAAIVTGIVFLCEGGWYGVFLILFGPVVAWVASWMLYAFGEIVTRLMTIDRNTGMAYQPAEVKEKYEADERAKYEAEESRRHQEEDRVKQKAEESRKRQEEKKRKAAEYAAAVEREEEKARQRRAIENVRQKASEEGGVIAVDLAEERQKKEQFRERAIENTEMGMATVVRLSQDGEVICPVCDRHCGNQLGLQKCRKCGCIIKAVKK